VVSGEIGVKDMTFFKNLWNDESGASAAEYALILAIVGTGIAVAAWGLGGAIGNSINTAKDCIAAGSEEAAATECVVGAAG
jgi:pilus assembly protein Flp/PilA